MATPERDYYTRDGTEPTFRRESNATAWFVGIIVALALLAIGYLVFSANSGPSTTAIQNSPAVTVPAPETPVPDTGATPMTTTPDAGASPMTTAPANDAAPANSDNGTPADSGASTDSTAPAAPAPAAPAAPAAQ
jgi:hypothetical protein